MSDPFVSTLGHPNQPVATHVKVIKVLASTNPEQISPTRHFFRRANVSGFKGNNTANSGSVYIGPDSSHPAVVVGAGLTVPIEPGDWPNDLSKWFVRGASGDGVVVDIEEGFE